MKFMWIDYKISFFMRFQMKACASRDKSESGLNLSLFD